MPAPDRAAFSAEDLRSLRLLAVALGIVGGGLLWIMPEEPLLIAGLMGGMLVASVATIYGLRRMRNR